MLTKVISLTSPAPKTHRVTHLAKHWMSDKLTEYTSAPMTLAEATAKMQEMAKQGVTVWIEPTK